MASNLCVISSNFLRRQISRSVSHGDPGAAADVIAFHGYLSDLRDWVAAAKKDGKAGASLIDTVLPEMKQKYGSWQFFDYFAKRNIADVEAELNGSKRTPIPIAKTH